MKNRFYLLISSFLIASTGLFAQGTTTDLTKCVNGAGVTYNYITSNAGWGSSGYYKLIDIDAETLTATTLPQHTGADGTSTSTNFSTGHFKTDVYTTTDGITYTPTGLLWPVNYYMSCFAPSFYTSAKSKVNNGATPSNDKNNLACSTNDNATVKSALWDKKGFIELSRQGTGAAPSLHGYIEIDSIPMCERIQWSYSSTGYKRGVKADINYNKGNGWEPLRWIASDYNTYEATFAEQGYQFDELIGKQDETDSYVSFRIRIWDGDSIHSKINPVDLSQTGITYTATMTPYASKQVVRIHQIRVFTGVVPTVVPSPKPLPTGIKATNIDKMNIYKYGNSVLLSEEADVQLYTIDGRLVYSGFTNKVNISSVPKGTYIIKAINAKGQVQNTKIMI